MDSQQWWDVGDWPHKQVDGGRLVPQKGGRWEAETPYV